MMLWRFKSNLRKRHRLLLLPFSNYFQVVRPCFQVIPVARHEFLKQIEANKVQLWWVVERKFLKGFKKYSLGVIFEVFVDELIDVLLIFQFFAD
jgi:hypothetical protein